MTNPRGATTIQGRPAPGRPDSAQVINLPVPPRGRSRRPAAPAAAAPLVQSPLARAAAAEHPVAGGKKTGPRNPARTPALRLTTRGRVVVAFLVGLAVWGAASAAWLAVSGLLAVIG